MKTGEKIIARVAIQGAKRGCGWRYTSYTADARIRSGYRYNAVEVLGMYPNKINSLYSEDYETARKKEGLIVVRGRPVQGRNAPVVA